jgi:tetratricopeptide (TPR) repeat protein
MELAEETLVRAQNRWRVTNVTEHQDVEYWLRLVRGALSVQSGRVIAPTAPLYAEMSQLLSDASRSYNEGVRLLGSGRRQDGLVRFSDAMEKTREVRLIFPMNQDARMLQLRVEQQTDPPAFNAAFRQRINEAVTGIKTRNPESFADLQDLAEINPRYPGIQALLSQAEIDMGFRPPPPNPADLARSAELTRSAEVIINNRDATRYEIAQTQLEEAIRLNPVNAQAQTFMDQLQIRMRGSGTIVHSSYVQEQYSAALQEFLRGNYLSANAIVERLLQNPENRRSTQIQDLKRRIDALL